MLKFFRKFKKETTCRIILLGKAGSGKGTQALKLRENFNIPVFFFGETIKENVQKKTKAGMILKQHIAEGTFASDYLVTDIFLSKFLSLKSTNSWIIEGFPRTILQNQIFEEKCSTLIKKMKVIYFDLSDEIATQRILSRLMCPSCFETYNNSKLPKVKGICDLCKSTLYHREDDNELIIKTRLKIFKEKSFPVIEYYKKQGNLYTIDADQSVEKIHNLIINIMQT